MPNFALRLGPFEITIHRRTPCGACDGRGWFYTKGTLTPVPPPPGYDGVALCGCGTAHAKLNDIHRQRAARQRAARQRAERRGTTEPPF